MEEISALSVMDFLHDEMTTSMRREQQMSFGGSGLERLLMLLPAVLSFGS